MEEEIRETHHFIHIKLGGRVCRKSLNLKNSPKHGGSKGGEDAEWKKDEEGLQSKVWSLNLLGHGHLVSSSSFGLIFLQGKMCFNGGFWSLQWRFQREKDGGRQ